MEPPTVLLLEDEPVIAADLLGLLLGLHCRVWWAADPAEAFDCCALRAPDLVLLNFRQHAFSDGMALARKLRTAYPIKVFFLTGARQQDLESAPYFEAGFEVLFKPFTRKQLKRALAQILA